MEFTAEAIRRAEKVRLIILDVDGVLTDGGLYIGAEGELFKPFYCRDGLGITIAHRAGLRTAIITGRQSRQLLYRAQELHITEVFQGNLDKRAAYRELKARLQLDDEEIAYFGDDLVDLAVMRQVGLPAAVGDAVPEVRDAAEVVSGFPGGHGAVRELIEFILKAQGKWQGILDDFKALDEADGLAQ